MAEPQGAHPHALEACPICGGEEFAEQAARPDARCLSCGALERHRALVQISGARLADGSGQDALEIGPLNATVFGEFLRARGWAYTGIDNSKSGNPFDPRTVAGLDYELDAVNLSRFGDNSQRLVIVQHVIEEIPDYRRALAEIARVLDPEGMAVLEIPYDPSRERSERHEPDGFGNVWAFGRDLLDTLGELFERVEVREYVVGAAHGRILCCDHAGHNAITAENALGGDRGWWGEPALAGEIEGYVSSTCVRPGQLLELHVSTDPPERYRITIHRLGWYDGAGGRTVAACPGDGSDVQGLGREAPPVSPGRRIERPGWPVTDQLTVERSWTTGVYLARLALTTGASAGRGAYVPFVVGPPLGTGASVLVQQPLMTAQAHNEFGGMSLTSSERAAAAATVSLERPLKRLAPDKLAAGWTVDRDWRLIRFLEREGFDLAYATDLDVHREPWSLGQYRLVIVSGEVLTAAAVEALARAVSERVNLALLRADAVFEAVELEDGETALARADGPLDLGARLGLADEPVKQPLPAGASLARAASGALVFVAGSADLVGRHDEWGAELPPNDELQDSLRNVLQRLTA